MRVAGYGNVYVLREAEAELVGFAYSKATQIKLVEEPSAEAINIKADYEAKNGALSAAAPKVFFRYYYINGATGEKSGEMLAEAKYTVEAGG